MGAQDIDVQELIGTLSSSEYVLTQEPLSPGMVVVMYQERQRVEGSPYWGKWFDCAEDEYKRNKETPIRFGWEYQTRRLFVELTEDYK